MRHKMKKETKIGILMGVLAVSLVVLFVIVGGTFGKIQFSEINTGIIPSQPNSTSVQNAIASTANVNVTVKSPSGTTAQAVISQSDYSTLYNEIPNSAISNVSIVTTHVSSSASSLLKFYTSTQGNTSIINTQNNVTLSNIPTIISGSPKFLINTAVILIDSSGNQYPLQSYYNIPVILQSLVGSSSSLPKFSLVDSQGHLLDLGHVVMSLNGVTQNPNSNVLVTGTFQVYLDNTLESQYTFYGQGISSSSSLLPIYINNKASYGFTFQNEGATWANNSTHIFQVYLNNVTATVTSGTNSQQFTSQNKFLAYLLPMTLDNSKIVQFGQDGNAITIPVADDTISACGVNAAYESNGYSYGSYGITKFAPPYNTPFISVSINGFQIISPFQSNAVDELNAQGSASSGIIDASSGAISCIKKTGITRNSVIDVMVGTTDYTIRTPSTEFDYKVDCFGPGTQSLNVSTQPEIKGCTNNFGGN